MDIGTCSLPDRHLRSVRTLTQQALMLFEDKVEKYNDRLRDVRRDIETVILEFEDVRPTEENVLRAMKSDLIHFANQYNSLSNEYVSYLKGTRTAASLREEASHRLVASSVRGKVDYMITEIESRLTDNVPSYTQFAESNGQTEGLPLRVKEEVVRNLSYSSLNKKSSVGKRRHSVTSQVPSTTGSNLSTIIQRQAAKVGLQTAKLDLKFAEEEAELLRKQAAIEAERKILESRKAVAVAQTTFEALETLANDTEKGDILEECAEKEQCQQDTLERTKQYVRNLKENREDQVSVSSIRSFKNFCNPKHSTPCEKNQDLTSNLNPSAKPFSPYGFDHLTRYIAKKDLISSRFSTYDDNPTHYSSWKATFQNIVTEVQASPLEHLDLLVRWLGPDSTKQVQSIRSANVQDPEKALKLAWERLDTRFGSPEIIQHTLQQRILDFPKLQNHQRKEFFDLADLATEIEGIKSDDQNAITLAYFDSSYGVNKLVSKLPFNLQEKWTHKASDYKLHHNGQFPPFTYFTSFLQNIAKMKNDPGFVYESDNQKQTQRSGGRSVYQRNPPPRNVSTRKTEVAVCQSDVTICPLHGKNHSLNECRAFRQKPLEERMKFIRMKQICFKCCADQRHLAKNCKSKVQCSICNAYSHPTALHPNLIQDEGESSASKVSTSCTQICGTTRSTNRSCAKILKVRVHPKNKPEEVRIVYAIVDDQSNQTLATSTLFDFFHERGPEHNYILVSCAGKKPVFGRQGVGYIVQSMDKTCSFELPTILECDEIPNNRDEIPTPQIARQFTHLQDIASCIPRIDNKVQIELLIGRDLLEVHHVMEQKIGKVSLPFAQKLPLGWVILGRVCLNNTHVSEVVNTNKTFVLSNGRPTLFEPCENQLFVVGSVFQKTEHDEKLGPSIDDQKFIEIMNSSFKKDADGRWTAPLPFKENRPILPNNKTQALKRALMLDNSFRRNPTKHRHAQDFMQKIFDHGHAEIAPPISMDSECWYLPLFGVYHPKKPDSIRMVFDSSARHEGLALNDVLFKGPDLTNNLLGVLLRFRKDEIAITGDIEQMFYNFKVTEKDRDFLRFLWHPDGDLDTPLKEYRMTVHVFGNTPSPSIATYGLHKAVQHADTDVQDFVNRNFYVDDGLTSCTSEEEAVSLMRRTQQALSIGGRLRLHKIASNSKAVLQQFVNDDLSKDLKHLDFGCDTLPVQRSLGVSWDTETDSIIFQVSKDLKPFTRRGVLSTINSLFDPIGFTAPVTLQGKLFLREVMSTVKQVGWDEPLQENFLIRWENWVNSLQCLEDIRIPRMYGKTSVTSADDVSVHIFCDASKEAIAAVAYLRVSTGNVTDVGFLVGKAKVAPTHGHTIPRLELCAGVLATELAETVKEELDIAKSAFRFYSDSRVVLGYISAEARRFHVYVCNRVSRIRSFCGPEQWGYISTESNPADIATRSFKTSSLPHSVWLQGPEFLVNEYVHVNEYFPVVEAADDVEIRKEVVNLKTETSDHPEKVLSLTARFTKFSSWNSLKRAITNLRKIAVRFQREKQNHHLPVEQFIIKEVQHEVYQEEVQSIMKGSKPPKNSSLLSLNPVLDPNGILRVGGRLQHISTNRPYEDDHHPIIIPKGHHIALLLVRHFHSNIQHQGRHLTECAIRAAGFWLVGGKRLIISVLRSCVTCKKLRGSFGWTKMADLPRDRLETGPPFTFVGIDTFGPWPIVYRKTRGMQRNHNRWAILFTCMVSRAVHVELIEELSSPSFINALRRFMAIRGPVKQFRSDRGTNFVGGVKELELDAQFIEKGPVANYLKNNRISWIFNPPHASHFGGVWERMIGCCRRILDALLLQNKHDLTHEVLSTFMLEVCAILNARPLVPVSTDPDKPEVLSPCQLLTQKNPLDDFDLPSCDQKDAIKNQWKRVQYLADNFWTRWRSEYLHLLQTRPKWESPGIHFNKGDIVLLKDSESPRNHWPMGVIEEAFKSEDELVRKVKVRVMRGDTSTSYVRPITQLVKLLEVK